MSAQTQGTARRLFRSSRPRTVGVRTTVLSVQREDSTSKQIAFQDEFLTMTGGIGGANVILPTPYEVARLYQFVDQSNMLRQCLDAYVTNTVGAGWEVGAILRDRDILDSENIELQSFIEHANSEESLMAVLKKVVWDREAVGFGFAEIIRDASGEPALLRHASSLYTRLCVKHPDNVMVEYDIPRGLRTVTVKEFRRFRRYVQIVGGQVRWFKEFGDPRSMDYRNGNFKGESGYASGYEATELYHFHNISIEPYGVPRWIAQLPSIIGSREAEEVNMRYFQDNTVPPILLTVGGGRLTQQSYQELNRILNTDGLGRDRQHKMVLLEAVGEGDSLDGKGTPVQLKVDKLTDSRQSDGLFKDYDEANMSKVRSSFRLPPVLVGMSQDVTFATANVSTFVAEMQVFAPARAEIDEILNKQLVNGRRGLKLRTAKLVSRTPGISSPDQVVKTLTAVNVMGGVTPRSAQQVVNTLLQTELPQYPKKGEPGYEEWMDKPIVFEQRKARAGDPHGNPPPKNTQPEQGLKPDAIKATEQTGNTNPDNPQNGAQ